MVEPQLPDKACVTLAATSGDNARAIETALRHCRGAAVRLVAGLYPSGPIEMPAHTTLWLDPGATLRAIADPRAFDTGGHRCGTIDDCGRGCRPLLHLADATGTAIMGDGTIDGAGGAPMAGTRESWWQLARRAQREGGKQNTPRLVVIDGGRGLTLYRTHFVNSANFHLSVNHVSGFTAWAVVIDAPADARNTDGIDPGASEDITITRSFISTGDDNVALKAGNSGGVHHVSIIDNHFYAGHGMSIGSETIGGVSNVLVRNLTLDGTTSGLRIKSDAGRGGLVQHVRFEHVCLRGNERPIDFTTRYDPAATGSAIPVYRDIVLSDVNGTGGRLIAIGHDPRHPLEITLDGVRFAGDAEWEVTDSIITIGTRGASPAPPGASGSVAQVQGDCTAAFLPFPAG